MNKVLIVSGSKSDSEIVKTAERVLDDFEIPYTSKISSAHRMPEATMLLAKSTENEGFGVVIAIAGYSAHLAGVIASWTTLPVISVPVSSSPLKGVDSIFSNIQMPGGVPVATMSLDKAGAINAAVFAAEILSLNDNKLKTKLLEYKKKLSGK